MSKTFHRKQFLIVDNEVSRTELSRRYSTLQNVKEAFSETYFKCVYICVPIVFGIVSFAFHFYYSKNLKLENEKNIYLFFPVVVCRFVPG